MFKFFFMYMLYILIKILIFLINMFLMIFNPLIKILIFLINISLSLLIMNMYFKFSWILLIFFILMMSGLMILFMYMTSLYNYSKIENFSKFLLMMFPIFLFYKNDISYIINLNMMLNNFFEKNYLMLYLNYNFIMFIIMILLYLLYIMILYLENISNYNVSFRLMI
uniref:NADH dehydrogenase subunit 6 n=1 Tax=Typhlodromus pineus TaxID=3061201 RepID=A0AAU6QE92_9ACAR